MIDNYPEDDWMENIVRDLSPRELKVMEWFCQLYMEEAIE
jgi:hypothetical protein